MRSSSLIWPSLALEGAAFLRMLDLKSLQLLKMPRGHLDLALRQAVPCSAQVVLAKARPHLEMLRRFRESAGARPGIAGNQTAGRRALASHGLTCLITVAGDLGRGRRVNLRRCYT